MIQIDDEYRITATSNAYNLQKIKKSKNEMVWETIKYGGTLEDVFTSYVKIKDREYVSKAEKQTLEDIKKEHNRILKFIKSLEVKF